MDFVRDELVRKEFEAGKLGYEQECFERLKRYEKKYVEWESLYGAQWGKRQERAKRFLFLGTIFNNWLPSIPKPPEKELPPPPCPPQGKLSLCGYPELFFDRNKEADLDPYFVQLQFEQAHPDPDLVGFDFGEPPDWKERSAKCKQRDKLCCCCCGKKKQLHVHHVIPKCYRGSHSLQNLVTLCKSCHENQEYYDHKYLLEKARAKK